MAIDFGKMIGPLPLGAWVVLVGGGTGFMLYQRNQTESDPLAGEERFVSTSENLSGVGGSGMWTDLTVPASGTGGSVAPTITDNDAWAVAAINHLIASGYDSTVADSAIRKYMAGENLTASELAMVRVALNKLGAPPVPLPPPMFGATPLPTIAEPTNEYTPDSGIVTAPFNPAGLLGQAPGQVFGSVTSQTGSSAPTGTVVANPAPTTKRVYTVTRGDSLFSIAQRMLGNGARWREIYEANKAVIGGNPNRILPGQQLTIP